MRKIIPYLVIALIAAIGVAYITLGPSYFLGGPGKSDIVTATRAAMVATAPSADAAENAKNAGIAPKGLCRHTGEASYACIVEVSVAGAAPRSLVSVMQETPDGQWIAAE